MKIKNVNTLSKAKQTAMLNDETLSKSHKIKVLFEAGYSIKQISELLSIRYNFAYNVISNYVNINQVEVESTKQVSKKSIIIELYEKGSSLKQISIETKSNYNYVHKIVKEYKANQVAE